MTHRREDGRSACLAGIPSLCLSMSLMWRWKSSVVNSHSTMVLFRWCETGPQLHCVPLDPWIDCIVFVFWDTVSAAS